jgi:MYXO-CTERM domain-containing protein
LVSGTNFIGTTTGTVALASDLAHWAGGTLSTFEGASQEAAMTPSIANGTRKNFTDLDFAAMNDIGWQVTAVPEADTWAMLLAGLGLVGFASRRRRV